MDGLESVPESAPEEEFDPIDYDPDEDPALEGVDDGATFEDADEVIGSLPQDIQTELALERTELASLQTWFDKYEGGFLDLAAKNVDKFFSWLGGRAFDKFRSLDPVKALNEQHLNASPIGKAYLENRMYNLLYPIHRSDSTAVLMDVFFNVDRDSYQWRSIERRRRDSMIPASLAQFDTLGRVDVPDFLPSSYSYRSGRYRSTTHMKFSSPTVQLENIPMSPKSSQFEVLPVLEVDGHSYLGNPIRSYSDDHHFYSFRNFDEEDLESASSAKIVFYEVPTALYDPYFVIDQYMPDYPEA